MLKVIRHIKYCNLLPVIEMIAGLRRHLLQPSFIYSLLFSFFIIIILGVVFYNLNSDYSRHTDGC